MRLEDIVKKFVRLPWEACRSGQGKDKEIEEYVIYHALAGNRFKIVPEAGNERNSVMIAIANTMVIAFTTQSGDEITKRNAFRDLPGSDRKYLFDSLGINPLEHDSLLFLVRKDGNTADLASYIAAAYAFTTWTKPFVLNFERLCSVAYQSMRDVTSEEQLMKTAGLLIITDLGVPTKINETAYAFLQNILAMRSSMRRMNIFFDTWHGEILSQFIKGKIPKREVVTETYIKMFPLGYRMDNYLVGAGVHIPGIDPVKRNVDEY